jgi:putative ABC transport system permease protein
MSRLPGVMHAEPFRAVATRLRAGPRSRNIGVLGVPDSSRLNRVVDASRGPLTLPPEGIVLSEALADVLAVRRGEQVTVEVLEGNRPVRQAVVADLVDDYLGTSAYMSLGIAGCCRGPDGVRPFCGGPGPNARQRSAQSDAAWRGCC